MIQHLEPRSVLLPSLDPPQCVSDILFVVAMRPNFLVPQAFVTFSSSFGRFGKSHSAVAYAGAAGGGVHSPARGCVPWACLDADKLVSQVHNSSGG